MQYLGSIIEKNLEMAEHVAARKRAAQSLNMCNEHMSPISIAHLYKAYVRPILYYGLENIKLKKNTVD